MTFLTNPHRFGAPPPPPDEFDSFYESKQALCVVQRTRMVEFFAGCALNAERWCVHNITGCGTGTMASAADEGFNLAADGTVGDCIMMDYNGLDHYCHDSSVWIAIVRTTSTASLLEVGFINNQDGPGGNTERSVMRSNRNGACLQTHTNDGAGATLLCTCVATSCNWNLIRDVLTACNNAFFIDGVSVACNTTRLPDQNIQPQLREFAILTATNAARIKYFEAYNV